MKKNIIIQEEIKMEIKFYTQENDKSALECGKIIINNISTLQEFEELYKTEYLYY